MEMDFAAIKKELELLRSAANKPDIFGAEVHGYRLNPPLSEVTIRRFEMEHAIVLPLDYRQYLLEVSNGGAGPYYGVFKLGEIDDGWGYASWKENDGFVGCLSKPFPFTSSWNDLTDEPEYDEENEEEYERQLEIFEKRYFNPENVNGAIPICHLGCALRQWLIVTGSESGNIWCDDRASDGGLYPLQYKDAERFSFYKWYRTWLDDALLKLKM